MPPAPRHPTQPSRRNAIKSIASCAILLRASGTFNAWAQPAIGGDAAATPLGTSAASWRAMSRVGYGPTPALVQAVQMAGSPQTWALQQVDLAYTASQQTARMVPEWADFNAPLPQLFDSFRQEREARAQAKAQGPKDSDAPKERPMDFATDTAPDHFSRRMAQQAYAWRLTSCSQPEWENPLLARMTEFWFNHLNVYVGKGSVRPFLGHYVVNVIRANALGKFEDLLLASARHPAMLNYLDQAQSVADGTLGKNGQTRGLNENYARELMELHTLGVNGGYTQTDVHEMARVLTGWTVSPRDASGFRFAPRMHDQGSKTVLGKTFPAGAWRSGEAEGIEAIRMLARHPATARRISLRVAQFFVADQPADALVRRMSQTFTSTQGDIRAVMKVVLESPDFWRADNRLFKTPMDYACSALATTDGDTGAQDQPVVASESTWRRYLLSLGFLANAGQPLHGWQTPDGYKFDAATWLVPEALTRRADYALALARQAPTMDYLLPFLSTATRDAVAQEQPALRAGLILASPDFMYK